VRKFTGSSRSLDDEFMKFSQTTTRQSPPIAKDRFPNPPGQGVVAGDSAGVEQPEYHLEIGSRQTTSVRRRSHSMIELDTRIPDRVPQSVDDLGDLSTRCAGRMDKNNIKVAARSKVASSITTHCYQGGTDLASSGIGEQSPHPLVGECGQGLPPIGAGEGRVAQRR
jgi:hypothetical protein